MAKAPGPSLAVTYLSLLVVLPIAAILSTAFAGGLGSFWAAISQPEAVAALKLTLLCSVGVALFNSVAGLLIAWVLVRDDFRGKRIVSAVIDLPFALPTIVAGLTLLSLYGPSSPFHIDVANTPVGILFALAFGTVGTARPGRVRPRGRGGRRLTGCLLLGGVATHHPAQHRSRHAGRGGPGLRPGRG